MSTEFKYKLKAFRSNFELACIFGIVVIIADMAWLVHDIVVNGLKVWCVFVFSGLLTGLIGTIYVVWRHNSILVRELCHTALQAKLLIVKHKIKHNNKK